MTIRSFVDLSHIDRMARPPEPEPQMLPFPQPDPADLIDGPRIPLMYGSAATQIRLSTEEWRRTDRGDEFTFQGKWRSIRDYRDIDCIVGKLVKVNAGTHDELIGVAKEADSEGAELEVRGTITRTGREGYLYTRPKYVQVVEDGGHLNMFERAIQEHYDGRSG